MITEIGHFCLVLAFVLSLSQSMVPIYASKTNFKQLHSITLRVSLLNAICVSFSFISLVWAFIVSDFSVALVAEHSHSSKPMIFKISGTWGNHEGSLLMWNLILSIFGAGLALTQKTMPISQKSSILGVQGAIGSAFLAFCLFTSNPFERLSNHPLDGNGLNPVLQDIGLALHPPTLYVGYVGLSLAFSFAVAALLTNSFDKYWAGYMRVWVQLAWCALTLGIGLGSWWAYYELGWGGWWFWDPVENASFMPWLVATALLHCVRILEKKLIFINWTILLSILAFSFSLLGTFIVRSGLLTSVHAFASDPSRGVFILIILGISIGVPLILYTIKSSSFNEEKSNFDIVSKESAILVNNLFLTTATLTVLIGTLYPLFLDAINGNKVSIGPAYYNATFAPIMAPVVFLMAIAPFLNWKKYTDKNFIKKIIFLSAVTFLGGTLLYLIEEKSIFALICGSLSIWLFTGVITDLISKIREAKVKLQNIKQIFFFISKINLGIHVAHIGVAIFLAGVTGEQFYKSEYNVIKKVGDIINIGTKSLKFDKIENIDGPNYNSLMATFTLYENNKFISKLRPEKRFYTNEKSQTTEAAILSDFWGDTYLVLGEGDNKTGWSLRIYSNPLVSWIWAGAFFMAVGGILSVTQKSSRFRND